MGTKRRRPKIAAGSRLPAKQRKGRGMVNPRTGFKIKLKKGA